MAQEREEITDYSLTRMTYSSIGAVIWLHFGKPLTVRLEFRFQNVPPKLVERNDGVINIFYPMQAYSDVVDILRNEKPVFLTFHRSAGYAYIQTGREPVGEGELNT